MFEGEELPEDQASASDVKDYDMGEHGGFLWVRF